MCPRCGPSAPVHQAGRRPRRQEPVVVGTQGVAVARKGTHEELQLVVGPLAQVDALPRRGVLQIVRAFVDVRVPAGHDADAEVAVDKLLALPGDDLLHGLDVLDGHLVRREGMLP